MKGIFSVLVENKSGVLSQISGLFARRGFNIDSLAVGETERHDISSMTIVSTGDQRVIDQIEKHLNKKIDVIKVCTITGARIMHVSPKHIVIELHNTPDFIENFIELVRTYGILEIQRTGTISLEK